jgi:hypothetical protein
MLYGDKTGDRRKTKKYGIDNKYVIKTVQQSASEYGNKTAAGSVPEQCDTDHHESEVVPVNDGKQSYQ